MTDSRRNVTVHQPADRPDVEVLVEGRGWVVGECRMQWQDAEDAWRAEVQYRSPKGHTRRIDAFPANRVRKDETDYSAGRGAYPAG